MVPGDVVADRFEIESRAGEGGMGTVYRARDRHTGLTVALKIIHGTGPSDRERFLQEGSLLFEMRHDGIVRHVAHGATPAGALYLAMEWLEGETLAERLSRRGLDIAESVAMVTCVADALGAAHGRGIIHRDIKPANLLLVDREPRHVKVLDFGIARLGGGSRGLTGTGAVLGTPEYMAPEQARGEGALDARVDVFSLGVVWFECLTGRLPFEGEHVMAVLAKILLDDAPSVKSLVPEIPEAIDELVASMLSKDRAARPADGRALHALLFALEGMAAPGEPRVSSVPEKPSALTIREQRLLSVVFAGGRARPEVLRDESTAPTMHSLSPDPAEDPVRLVAERFGAHAERLADGSAILVITGTEAATDLAARAARCALALQVPLGFAPMAIATGRGDVSQRWPVGEVIDRGVGLLGRARGMRQGIALDEVTAGLLDARWVTGAGPQGIELRGERLGGDGTTRTLLGRPAPCLGRDREIGTIVSLYEECVDASEARVALVTGFAGVGKSRVRYEVMQRLAALDEPPTVLLGRGDPVRAGAPFEIIAPVVRAMAGVLENEPLDARHEKLVACVARHVAEADRERIAVFLAELVGAPFPVERSVQLRAARADVMLMGDQLRRALEDFFAAECAAGPLVLVLEDLHWGDLPSVRALLQIVRRLRDAPFMVLVLARPELQSLFPDLWAIEKVVLVSLAGLSRKACERLVTHALGGVPRAVIDRLVAQSEGNAFYLEELVRAVADGMGDALPGTVMAMVQSRLERLTADARRTLRAASVFGEVFWASAVHTLLGQTARTVTVLSAFAELTDGELIVPRTIGRFAEQSEYRFRHSLLREAAYAMLTEADRALGHRLAADWLEAAGENEAAVIAEHLARAGEPLRAAAWFDRAAAQALDANDFRAAASRADRGLASGATGALRGSLLVQKAEAHGHLAESDTALEAALEALELLPSFGKGWFDALRMVSRTSIGLGRFELPAKLAHEFVERLDAGARDTPFLRAANDTAFALMYGGDSTRAFAILDRVGAIDLATLGDPSCESAVHLALATIAMRDGDTGALLIHEQAALAALERAGEARVAASEAVNVGFAQLELGMYPEAELSLRAALASAERLGLPRPVALAQQNLGAALVRQGKFEEGERLLRICIEAFDPRKERRLIAGGYTYLAQLQTQRGEYVEAKANALKATELFAEARGSLPQAVATLARVLRLAGDAEGGLVEATRAIDLLREVGTIDEGESLVRLEYAESLSAAGRTEQAKVALHQARDALLARVARFREASHREVFLTSVPENARTLALCDQWDIHRKDGSLEA